MKTITVKIEVSCDGPWPSDEIIENGILKNCIQGVILSEDVDGTDDWAIIPRSVEVKSIKECCL